MSLEMFLQHCFNALTLGSLYALIAIGYTMVYGILRLINFAHGDVFMVAGLMMIYFTASLPMYLALPLVVVCTALLGFLIERAAYKPLRSAPRMSLMISAIGVSYLIQNLAFYLTGGLPKPVTNPIPWISDTISVFGASTKRVTLVTPVLTILLVFVLLWLTKKTKMGMAMRAASKDFETAQLMGIKINRVEVKNITPPKDIQVAMEKQMRAERERREAILIAEGEKKSKILIAEGQKEAAILEAEANKQTAIREAEGQAEAILMINKATADGLKLIREAGADDAVIKLKSLEAFEKVADGQATKIIIPSEIQGLAGLAASVKELIKE